MGETSGILSLASVAYARKLEWRSFLPLFKDTLWSFQGKIPMTSCTEL